MSIVREYDSNGGRSRGSISRTPYSCTFYENLLTTLCVNGTFLLEPNNDEQTSSRVTGVLSYPRK